MINNRHKAPLMFINLHAFAARNNNKQDALGPVYKQVG